MSQAEAKQATDEIENAKIDEKSQASAASGGSETTESLDVERKPEEEKTVRRNTATQQQHELDMNILEELSREMIKTTGEYVKGEIDVCIADYKLLEQMNKLVIDKYRALTINSSRITSEMDKLNEAYAHLAPLLSQIDNVEKSVDELEITAGKLDAYSKRLEMKFKQFTDRISNR